MHPDRRKWNAKHAAKSWPGIPAALVRRFHNLAPRGRALDLAAGSGRHALFLARQGYRVDALDISDGGLRRFARRHPNIRAACVDLEHFSIPPRRYDLIVNIRYLSRRLMPYIVAGLRPGGVVIFETFLRPRPLLPEDRHREAYFLRENELLNLLAPLRVLYYRESGSQPPDHPFPRVALVALNDSKQPC